MEVGETDQTIKLKEAISIKLLRLEEEDNQGPEEDYKIQTIILLIIHQIRQNVQIWVRLRALYILSKTQCHTNQK